MTYSILIVGGDIVDKVTEDELIEGLTLELRRGTLVLSVLSQLKTPQYGYSLVTSLQDKGMIIDASTLYPLLRRLERQGILESSWDTDGTKPRKYYVMSKIGESVFRRLCDIWKDIVKTTNSFIE